MKEYSTLEDVMKVRNALKELHFKETSLVTLREKADLVLLEIEEELKTQKVLEERQYKIFFDDELFCVVSGKWQQALKDHIIIRGYHMKHEVRIEEVEKEKEEENEI